MKVRTQVAWESQWDTLMLLGVEQSHVSMTIYKLVVGNDGACYEGIVGEFQKYFQMSTT